MNGEEALEYMRQNPEEVLLDKNGHRWVWDGPFDDFDGFAKHFGGDLSGSAPFTVADPDAPAPSPAAGRKDDTGKPRISLLPADVLREVIAVFEHGAAKYGDDNWRGVEPAERYRDASFRHTHLEEGPDPDSGIDALAHGIASLMILRARQLEAGK